MKIDYNVMVANYSKTMPKKEAEILASKVMAGLREIESHAPTNKRGEQ